MFTVETKYKLYKIRALDMTVLVVASVTKGPNLWVAYIRGVPGINHNKEWKDVLDHGDKLPEKVAGLLFPDIALKYRWRD